MLLCLVSVSYMPLPVDVVNSAQRKMTRNKSMPPPSPPSPPPTPPPSPSPLPFPTLRRFSCVLVGFLGFCPRVLFGCFVGGLGFSWFFLGSVSGVSWVFLGFLGFSWVLSWVSFGCSVGRLGFSCFFLGFVSGVSWVLHGFSLVFSGLSVLGGSWTARRGPSVIAAASTH